MSDWKFLGRHAITTYASNPPCEYVLKNKVLSGYVEKQPDGSWAYYEFGPAGKGATTPPEPVLKGAGPTPASAVQSGLA